MIVPATTIVPAGAIVPSTTTLPLVPPPASPSVCPGCGRCRDCGQPYAAPPVLPGLPNPFLPPVPPSPIWYVGDPPGWWNGGAQITSVGVQVSS